MKFTVNWLKEWVPVTASVDELCTQLTNAGLEVERAEPVAGSFSGVVAAKIVSLQPHPDAAKLSVCEVDAGPHAATVVCGAPNVEPGLTCPLATVGAVLADGTEVERAMLRGVASHGMLCSVAELGLGDDASGVLELGAELEPGVDLHEALALPDVAVEVDLTPNRGDCLSIRGLARELGVLSGAPVAPPAMDAVPATTETEFPVHLANAAGCPRYLGRVIEGVDATRPTPAWLRERLRRCGLRPIDPVVDVTNYVMLELGQPMHAFDHDVLAGGISVRNAEPGESLTLLDGRAVVGDASTLLIADAAGPVAIAGVMGGERSGVGAATRNVFLECAFFTPLVVAATARRFGLHTDAAHRYERGVDFQLQNAAMERATRLLLDIAGGRAGPVVEAVSEVHLPTPSTVTLRKARLDHLVGESIPGAAVTRIFERLQLSPTVAGEGFDTVWTVVAPSHRFDLACEEDLVEEVLRIHGYNEIGSRVPQARVPLGRPPATELPVARLATLLADLGYSEAITYSFVDAKTADLLDPGSEPLRVVNPVSNEHAAMRTNLLPGLVQALRRNLARRSDRVRLFETGQCFRRDAEGVVQTTLCGGVLHGRRDEENWTNDDAQVDFFDVKGDVENALALGGRDIDFVPAADPVLHPGQSALLRVDGQDAGRLGRLHPEVEAALDLPTGVFVFEFDADAALAVRRRHHSALSRQPSVRRDLALVVDRGVEAGRIEAIVRKCLGDIVSGVRLFDVYAGAGIDADRKSIGIGLTFQHASRTLRDTEINQHVEDTLAVLNAELGARLR